MDFTALLNTIITLFILLIAGFIAGKLNIIDETGSKKLSRLIISIGQPFLIISSLIGAKYSVDNLILGLKTFLIGLVVHAIMAFAAYFFCIKFRDIDERKISEFSMIFGNVGFLGFPILESLFGSEGLFMGTFFMISFQIVLWIWGIAILARKREDIKLTPKKILLNYATVPAAIGLAIYALNFNLPAFVYSGSSYLASLCTPISMLITGALLSRRTMKQIFLSPKMYYISLVKLIIIPLLICVIAKLIGMDYMWIVFLTAVSAMPSASTVSMLADLYDISPEYAAQSVGTTSLLSIASMPLVMLLAEQIANL